MKNQRQEKIIQLISRSDIETQDELIEQLRREGFSATQATISRDIRELKISKVLGTSGKYHYTVTNSGTSDRARNPYVGSVVSVESAENLVVIKTHPGLANAVAAGIDSMYTGEILGCVAGDDTIIAVARDAEVAVEFCDRFRKSISIG